MTFARNDTMDYSSSRRVPMGSLERIELVTKPIRDAIIEGRDTNLPVLLMSIDYTEAKCYSGKPEKAEKRYAKLLNDPSAYRDLSLPEFIRAFTSYKNTMCEAFPSRRAELDAYERDIIDMASKFQGTLFYDYHRAFSAKAAAYLLQKNIKVDWSVRDQSLFLETFSWHRAEQCAGCFSTGHKTEYCPKDTNRRFKKLDTTVANNRVFSSPGRSQGPRTDIDMHGRKRQFLGDREICNNYNARGCYRPNCEYLHVCSACNRVHPLSACESRSRDQPPAARDQGSPSLSGQTVGSTRANAGAVSQTKGSYRPGGTNPKPRQY